MKIDWKKLSKTEGYRSLKRQFIKSGFGDNESLGKFNWVISRAKHYSHVLDISVGDILTVWERERNYCWFNFYQDFRVPKLKKESVRRSHEARIRGLLSCRADEGKENS